MSKARSSHPSPPRNLRRRALAEGAGGSSGSDGARRDTHRDEIPTVPEWHPPRIEPANRAGTDFHSLAPLTAESVDDEPAESLLSAVWRRRRFVLALSAVAFCGALAFGRVMARHSFVPGRAATAARAAPTDVHTPASFSAAAADSAPPLAEDEPPRGAPPSPDTTSPTRTSIAPSTADPGGLPARRSSRPVPASTAHKRFMPDRI